MWLVHKSVLDILLFCSNSHKKFHDMKSVSENDTLMITDLLLWCINQRRRPISVDLIDLISQRLRKYLISNPECNQHLLRELQSEELNCSLRSCWRTHRSDDDNQPPPMTLDIASCHERQHLRCWFSIRSEIPTPHLPAYQSTCPQLLFLAQKQVPWQIVNMVLADLSPHQHQLLSSHFISSLCFWWNVFVLI